MQADMHYYATYAIARAAGFVAEDAEIIAYSCQYVDDSTTNDSQENKDGGLVYCTATAHHPQQVIVNKIIDSTEQRRVWVPFHFFPGNRGETLSERMLCRKNSSLVREMFENHISKAIDKEYGLELIGIASHVFEDTFSHYGFSGFSSRENKVIGDSFEFLGNYQEDVLSYLKTRHSIFIDRFMPEFIMKNWRKLASDAGEESCGALGHGAVGTYPDRPFLNWKFNYELSGEESIRNNPDTFLEASELLYDYFCQFADRFYGKEFVERIYFKEIVYEIERIINIQADKQGRTNAWKEAILNNRLFRSTNDEALDYNCKKWENDKETFQDLEKSDYVLDTSFYRFQQAAYYHRFYTLKELLPKYGLAIY